MQTENSTLTAYRQRPKAPDAVLRCLTLIALRDTPPLPDDNTLRDLLERERAARRHPDDLLVRLSDGGVGSRREWPWGSPFPLVSAFALHGALCAQLDRYRLRTTDGDCAQANERLAREGLLVWAPARFKVRHAWALGLNHKGREAADEVECELDHYLGANRLRGEQRLDDLVAMLRRRPDLVDRVHKLLTGAGEVVR
jgi:hypothetical protein